MNGISDENVHLLNFIHQICCMKCVHWERRGVWVGSAKVIMKFYRNLLYNILQQLCLKTKHFEFSSAIHLVYFFWECSFVRSFVCIKEYRHSCQKIFFARCWNTVHRVAHIRYKQKWCCTCRKTMCRFFGFELCVHTFQQILCTEIPENLWRKSLQQKKHSDSKSYVLKTIGLE